MDDLMDDESINFNDNKSNNREPQKFAPYGCSRLDRMKSFKQTKNAPVEGSQGNTLNSKAVNENNIIKLSGFENVMDFSEIIPD